MQRTWGTRSGVASLLAASLLSSTLMSAASAQDAAQSNGPTVLEQVQVTATRRPQSATAVPAALTIVDATEIREASAQTAMDLLHGQAGTFVQQTTPGQAIVIVRGLKGSEVLHLVDGLRLNTAFFRNAPNQYMALVDGQSLERIEVLRSPASALYGGDAMGGVVQLFTAQPDFNDSSWDGYAALRTQSASADDSIVSRLEGAIGREGLAVSGGLTYQDVGELRIGGGTRRDFTAFRSRAANLKVRGQWADQHELMAQVQWLEQPSTPRVDELVPGFGQVRPTSSEFAFEPQSRRLLQLRYRNSGSTALWDALEVQLGRQTIIDDRRSVELGTVNRELEDNSSRLDAVTLQVGKELGSHYLTYGAEHYADTIDSARRRLNLASGLRTERPPRFPDGSTMDQLGIFVADSWTLGRWLLDSSLRYSQVKTRLPELGGFAVEVDDDDVSGSFGAALTVSPQLRLVTNLGRAFRPPNVFDLGTFGDRPGNRFNLPNPQLRPERVTTFDVGLKYASRGWNLEAFVFASRYRDKISSVLTGESTPTGRLVVQSRNTTRLDLSGAELAARGLLSPALEVYGTLTYTRGDERVDGTEFAADRIPPLFGKLGALWRTGERFTLEGYSYYALRQDRLSPRDRIDPRIDPEGTQGWITLNARAAMRLGTSADVSLRLENLTDRAYREHGSGLDEPGRNAILTLELRL